MAKFETVYCQELHTKISTEDYIAYRENHTEPLTLLCPDEECRHDCPDTRMHVRGCEPHKIYKVSPHFATNPNRDHSKRCYYTTISQDIEKVIAKNKQIREEFLAADQPIYNIIQEFSHKSSRESYDEMFFTAQTPDFYSDIKQQIRANKYTSEAMKQRYCYTTPRRTNSLAKVVDAAKELADHNELEKAFITMNPKSRCTYERLFFPMSRLNKVENWLYVFLGKASIFLVDDTFYISCYPIEYNSKKLPVIIKVNPDTNTPTFMYAIKDCHKNWKTYREQNKNFYIYIFGTPVISNTPTELSEKYTHFKNDDNSCITFTPFAPNCMVIRDFAIK